MIIIHHIRNYVRGLCTAMHIMFKLLNDIGPVYLKKYINLNENI